MKLVRNEVRSRMVGDPSLITEAGFQLALFDFWATWSMMADLIEEEYGQS